MLRASFGTALALLGALGATAAGTLTANASPVAEPAADTFSVVSAAASASNPDQLVVVVDSPSTVAGLTARFINYGATTDAYDQVLAQQGSSVVDPTDPAQTQSTWTASIPAGSSGLALGNYTINLSGTFTDNSSGYSLADVAPFYFHATSAVTLTAANQNLSYPNTEPGLTGTVTLTNPDGTPDTDYSQLTLDIVSGNEDVSYPTVARDGTFTDPSYAPFASGSVVAEIWGYGVDEAKSAPVKFTVTDAKPTLKLKVNSVTETYGKSVTVTGTATYLSGSTAEPLAGQGLWVANQAQDWSTVATGTTGADGSFSITLPKEQAGTTLYLGTTGQPGLTPVVVPLTVNVVRPTIISGFKVSLNQYWGLTVSGCLGFVTGDASVGYFNGSGLTMQYANSTTGPWKKLFAVSANQPNTNYCGIGGIRFTASHLAPKNYAYYRVVYAGTKGATTFTPTTSATVLTWRYDDRITGFKVSPATVNAGGKLTVKGTLQYYYSGWHNYSGQLIWINLRPNGSSTWYWEVKVKTNSKGQFSATFQDPVSATWEAAFYGNNSNGVGHLSYGSSEIYVRLK